MSAGIVLTGMGGLLNLWEELIARFFFPIKYTCIHSLKRYLPHSGMFPLSCFTNTLSRFASSQHWTSAGVHPTYMEVILHFRHRHLGLTISGEQHDDGEVWSVVMYLQTSQLGIEIWRVLINIHY